MELLCQKTQLIAKLRRFIQRPKLTPMPGHSAPASQSISILSVFPCSELTT
jgi:hypothetical protein